MSHLVLLSFRIAIASLIVWVTWIVVDYFGAIALFHVRRGVRRAGVSLIVARQVMRASSLPLGLLLAAIAVQGLHT